MGGARAERCTASCGHRPSWRRSALGRAPARRPGVRGQSDESAGRLQGFAQVPAGRVVVSLPHRRRHSRAGSRAGGGLMTWAGRRRRVSTAYRSPRGPGPWSTCRRSAVWPACDSWPSRQCSERRCTVADLGSTLDRIRRRGKPGVQRMERVLDDIGPGADLPTVGVGAAGRPVSSTSPGLPVPLHEHPLPNEAREVGFRRSIVGRRRCGSSRLTVAAGTRGTSRWCADADRTLEAQALGYETVPVAVGARTQRSARNGGSAPGDLRSGRVALGVGRPTVESAGRLTAVTAREDVFPSIRRCRPHSQWERVAGRAGGCTFGVWRPPD